MKRKSIGIINGIIASVSYGMNPLFTLPLISRGMGVNSILFYRYLFAVILYYFWLKFFKKTSLKITKKEFLILFAMAILFSFSSLTLFSSFTYIDSGVSCTILFVYPIIVAILSRVFFKEKLGKTVIFAILMTTFGIFLLYGGDRTVALDLRGVALVLTSALSYAIYIVGVKNIKIVNKMRPDKLSFYIMLFGLTLYVYNLNFCTKLQMLDGPLMWIFAIALAIIPTIISLETISLAIKLIGSTTTAVLGALEPMTAIFFGILFFSEKLTFLNVIGVILILVGVVLIILKKLHK